MIYITFQLQRWKVYEYINYIHQAYFKNLFPFIYKIKNTDT